MLMRPQVSRINNTNSKKFGVKVSVHQGSLPFCDCIGSTIT